MHFAVHHDALKTKAWIDLTMGALFRHMSASAASDDVTGAGRTAWVETPKHVTDRAVLARIPATEAEIEACHTLWSRRHVMCAGVPAVPVVPTAV